MSSFIKGLGLDLFEFNERLIAVVEENNADASFCISSFMWQALNTSDTGVCLLALHHSLRHYYHVGMRLGYNLSSNLGSRFLPVDTVDIREAHLKLGRKDLQASIVLDVLQQNVLTLMKQNKNIFILIDDLSDFLNLGVSVNDVLHFIQYLRISFKNNCTFVFGTHYHDEDEEQAKIRSFLLHIADLRVNIKCLETGFSKEVTGCIEITKSNKNVIEGWSNPVLYHYKTKERSINVFQPGNITFSY